MKKVNVSKLNLVIDIIMFFVMMVVAGIGFMIKYLLIPGFRRNEVYGKDVELYFWELDRHQWGTVHLVFSLFLLFLLILHIVLHWKMICNIFRRMISPRPARRVLAMVFMVACLSIAGLPFLLKPYIAGSSPKYRHQTEQEIHENHRGPSAKSHAMDIPAAEVQLANIPGGKGKVKEKKKNHQHGTRDLNIKGKMTLQQVAVRYNIPAEELAEGINVPAGQSREKLGRLQKQYGFRMSELREIVARKVAR